MRSFGVRSTSVVSSTAGGAIEIELPETAPTPTIEQGRRLLRRLFEREPDKPTAIFAHNDLMALGALDVLRATGLRCPDDVSLIGYNDSPQVDRVSPPLTTIRLHSEELGRLVAEMTVRAITSPTRSPIYLKLPPELIVRESTGLPRSTRVYT